MANLEVRIELAMRGRGPDAFQLDVGFDVPPGVTVLFGPSGSGKSRTLGCIAGLARPDKGRIALGAEVWFDESRRWTPIHQRRVAYVFQSLALFPHMTAEDNVAYGIARDAPKEARRARAREMLERMRVGHLAQRKPRTFSGGEAQRVALARAFAMRPSVMLLDEPFSALDSGVKRALLTEVAEWVSKVQVPTILVTHHAEEARILGERVVFLENGHVVRRADVDDAGLSEAKLRVGREAPESAPR